MRIWATRMNKALYARPGATHAGNALRYHAPPPRAVTKADVFDTHNDKPGRGCRYGPLFVYLLCTSTVLYS